MHTHGDAPLTERVIWKKVLAKYHDRPHKPHNISKTLLLAATNDNSCPNSIIVATNILNSNSKENVQQKKQIRLKQQRDDVLYKFIL